MITYQNKYSHVEIIVALEGNGRFEVSQKKKMIQHDHKICQYFTFSSRSDIISNKIH